MGKKAGAATPAIAAAQAAGIGYEIRSYVHDPRTESFGEEAALALGESPARVFKTLIVEVDGAGVCAIIPVTTTLSLKSVAAAVSGKRAVMMDPARAQRLTGYVLGGISPLGQRTPLPTLLDELARGFERILVSAGRRGLEIEVAPDDLLALTKGRWSRIRTVTGED